MSVFGASGSSSVRVRDLSRVVRAVSVAGVRRRDARVRQVVQSSGAPPSVCMVEFPLHYYGDEPAREGDRVEVWIDPSRTGAPLFRGYIPCQIQRLGREPGANTVAYEAVDVRQTLMDSVCSRDFNVVDKNTGTAEEALTVRQIAAAIMKEYASHQAGITGRSARDRVQLALATIPDGAIGEFTCRGEPHGAALERLLQEAGDGVLRLRVVYHAASNVLEAFSLDQGLTQTARRGTDMTVGPEAQAWGSPNVGEIQTRRDWSGIINEWVLESPDVTIEQAVTLTPAWPGTEADLDALLASASTTLASRMAAIPNPGCWDGMALLAGRLWAIPTITDLDGTARRLEPRPELLQQDYYTSEAMWVEHQPRPFVAVQWDEGSEWEPRMDGFSIEGKYVLLDNAAIRLSFATEADDVQFTLLEDVAGYYVCSARGIPSSIIGDAVNGIYTEPGGGGSKLTVKAGNQAAPNLPANESEITYNTEIGYLLSTTARPVWVKTASRTRQRRKLPYAIKLVAAWVSKTPLQASTGRVGNVSRMHVKRMAVESGFAYKLLRNTLRVHLLGEVEVAGNTSGVAELTEVAGPIEVQDDGAALADLARRRSLRTREAALTQTVDLPLGDLGYKVGSLLAVNGDTLAATIQEIHYDLDNLRTKLVVANR